MDAGNGNFPLHLVQRSRRGEPCFGSEADCRAYLRALKETAARLDCAVHAYALMGNHVHILVTPARGEGAARLMRGLAERHGLSSHPSGNARGESSPSHLSFVHDRRYVLACMRYIELNPVRARFVRRPEDHAWSSYRANALGDYDPVLTPHPVYCALGRAPEARRIAYRALFQAPLMAREPLPH